MKWRSKKISSLISFRAGGFSLIEIMPAVIILALICSSVVVVVNRSAVSAADSALRMRAFSVARDNMEVLLASSSVSQGIDWGTSERYPEIGWETRVESFYEPVTNRMWIQATCSAEYESCEGEMQKVELTHWITNVSKKDALKILEELENEKERLEEMLIDTVQEAAEYVGADEETILAWEQYGMAKTDDGKYIVPVLDLYDEKDGNLSPEEKEWTENVAKDFSVTRVAGGGGGRPGPVTPGGPKGDPTHPSGPKGPTTPDTGTGVPDSPTGPQRPLTMPEIIKLLEQMAQQGQN